jgi:hypothetical protein
MRTCSAVSVARRWSLLAAVMLVALSYAQAFAAEVTGVVVPQGPPVVRTYTFEGQAQFLLSPPVPLFLKHVKAPYPSGTCRVSLVDEAGVVQRSWRIPVLPTVTDGSLMGFTGYYSFRVTGIADGTQWKLAFAPSCITDPTAKTLIRGNFETDLLTANPSIVDGKIVYIVSYGVGQWFF